MEHDWLAKAFSKGPTSAKQYESTSEKDGMGDMDPDDTADEDPEGPNDGHYAAAKEMMDCHAAGDHEGYAKALHSFVKMSKD